jgi:pilus assembly protein CpaE
MAFTPWIEISLETWQTLLACVASLSAFVIIDTAAIADALLSQILAQADEILIVTTPEATSWRTAVDLLETLQEAEEVQARVHMLLNKADMRNGLQTFFLRKQVREVPFISICEDGGLATYALNRGVPFVLSHPHTLLSRQIYGLADYIYSAAGTDALDTESSLRTPPQTNL